MRILSVFFFFVVVACAMAKPAFDTLAAEDPAAALADISGCVKDNTDSFGVFTDPSLDLTSSAADDTGLNFHFRAPERIPTSLSIGSRSNVASGANADLEASNGLRVNKYFGANAGLGVDAGLEATGELNGGVLIANAINRAFGATSAENSVSQGNFVQQLGSVKRNVQTNAGLNANIGLGVDAGLKANTDLRGGLLVVGDKKGASGVITGADSASQGNAVEQSASGKRNAQANAGLGVNIGLGLDAGLNANTDLRGGLLVVGDKKGASGVITGADSASQGNAVEQSASGKRNAQANAGLGVNIGLGVDAGLNANANWLGGLHVVGAKKGASGLNTAANSALQRNSAELAALQMSVNRGPGNSASQVNVVQNSGPWSWII